MGSWHAAEDMAKMQIELESLVRRAKADGHDSAAIRQMAREQFTAVATPTLYRWLGNTLRDRPAVPKKRPSAPLIRDSEAQPPPIPPKPIVSTPAASPTFTRTLTGPPSTIIPAQDAPGRMPPLAGATVSINSLPLAEAVSEAITSIRSVLSYAKGEAGYEEYRDVKMVLSSSSALASAVKHATALYEIILSAERTEAFHAAVIEEVKRESPECARRIFDRLQRLNSQLNLDA